MNPEWHELTLKTPCDVGNNRGLISIEISERNWQNGGLNAVWPKKPVSHSGFKACHVACFSLTPTAVGNQGVLGALQRAFFCTAGKGNSLEFIHVYPICNWVRTWHQPTGIYIQLGGLKEYSCEHLSRDGFCTRFGAQTHKVVGFFSAVSCLYIANRESQNLLFTSLIHVCFCCETTVFLLWNEKSLDPLQVSVATSFGLRFAHSPAGSWPAARRTWLHPAVAGSVSLL